MLKIIILYIPHQFINGFLVEIENFTSFEMAFSGFASCRAVLGNAPTVVAVAAALSVVVAIIIAVLRYQSIPSLRARYLKVLSGLTFLLTGVRGKDRILRFPSLIDSCSIKWEFGAMNWYGTLTLLLLMFLVALMITSD